MFTYLENKNVHHIPIPKMIENIKFNPNHKENNNVKVTNMRSKVALKYNDNKWSNCKCDAFGNLIRLLPTAEVWSTVDKIELFDELYKRATDLFNDWSKIKDFITDDMKKNYKNFNNVSQLILSKNIINEIHKKAYIYTKNNDNILD